jgi:hypothetical protein
MAKSKNHTNHNQNFKAHRNGIQRPTLGTKISTKGVSYFPPSCPILSLTRKLGASHYEAFNVVECVSYHRGGGEHLAWTESSDRRSASKLQRARWTGAGTGQPGRQTRKRFGAGKDARIGDVRHRGRLACSGSKGNPQPGECKAAWRGGRAWDSELDPCMCT